MHNALPLLELNIKCNRDVLEELNTSIEAKTLQWGQDCDIKFTPDIILLADCIYYEGVRIAQQNLQICGNQYMF